MSEEARDASKPIPERPPLRSGGGISREDHPGNVQRHMQVVASDASAVLERLTSDMPMDLDTLRGDIAILARSISTMARGMEALAYSTDKAVSDARTASNRARRPW